MYLCALYLSITALILLTKKIAHLKVTAKVSENNIRLKLIFITLIICLMVIKLLINSERYYLRKFYVQTVLFNVISPFIFNQWIDKYVILTLHFVNV